MLLQLSFLGDAVFELMVREYAISLNIVKLKDLQKFTLDFVTAKRQAYFVNCLLEKSQPDLFSVMYPKNSKDLIECVSKSISSNNKINVITIAAKKANTLNITFTRPFLYPLIIFNISIKIIDISLPE